MGIWIGRGRKARQTFGFDDVTLVPSGLTLDEHDVDVSWNFGTDITLKIPFMAAAMDGVVDTKFAVSMSKTGGVAVLNLEGLQTKYENPKQYYNEIVGSSKENVTEVIQKIYQEPVKEDLIVRRIGEIKEAGGLVAVSATPAKAQRYGEIAKATGVDIFVVQSTVTTARYQSSSLIGLNLKKFCSSIGIPVFVGNCVSYSVALELMDCDIAGILVGVGPGAACTTREVLGIGVPQITAVSDVAAARDFYFKCSKRYVSVVADGGMRSSGDICKAIAAGADAVMLGSAFAKALEAPGQGYHWGMATTSSVLPRGTRIYVGVSGSLHQILFGPSAEDTGTQNLVGALKKSMGSCGARTVSEMQRCEMIVAPSIRSEGKYHQRLQQVGMGK